MKKFLLFSIALLFSIVSFAQVNNFNVGDAAPDFTVTDVHGKTHKLSDYTSQGKNVIIDFFFTTCGPCQQAAPKLNAFYHKYGCNKGNIIVLGLDNGDNNAQVIDFENTYPGENPYPSCSGIEGGANAVCSTYGVEAYPTFCLIGADGKFKNTDIWPVSVPLLEAACSAAGITLTPMDCNDPVLCDPVTNLTAKTDVDNRKVTLTWSTPGTPSSGAKIIIESHNIWQDETGYQMLLDKDANTFGTIIPTTGPLAQECNNIPANLYDPFEYKIPENADPSCSAVNKVVDGQSEITIPAGVYDYCITNPAPSDAIWIASSINGRKDNYNFENGKTYHFTMQMAGNADSAVLVITNTKTSAAVLGLSYNVYRNSVKIGTITDTTYTDTDVPNGNHNYCIEVVCTEGLSPKVCVNAYMNVGIDDKEPLKVKLYPNPVNNTLNIIGNNIETVNVYNAQGKLIGIYKNTNTIDVSNYTEGLYFAEIKTIDGKSAKQKFVVKK